MSQNYDEQMMRQSVLFTENLKEMKNLRKQLYSSAEHFEHSFASRMDHQRILIFEGLRDYSAKALVNTIDHLGSIASKIENSLDEKLAQVCNAELRFSCIEQRVGAWKEMINSQGLAQQMLLIDTPKHHKHYILPNTASKKKIQLKHAFLEYKSSRPDESSVGIPKKTAASPFLSKRDWHPVSPALEPPLCPQAFFLMRSVSKKVIEKHKLPLQGFPVIQTGPLLTRLTSQNSLNAKKQNLLPPVRRSSSSAIRDQKARDLDEYTTRTKRIFRAFVSMRKPNKDVQMQGCAGRI